KGATEKLALEIRRLAAAVFGAGPDDIVLENKMASLKGNPEAALPFMACGAIVNANNAVLPMDARDITLNCRHVYIPPFEMPDFKTGYIESPSPFSSLGTKGMGEGGGAAIHAVCAAIQDALRSAGIPGVVSDSHNPAERVWRLITNPEESRALVEVVST